MNSYQEPVLTEFASLGLACIVINDRTRLEITEITRRGEKADYWLGDDRALMLEVSGQQQGSLDRLFAEKSRQLLLNPFGKPGYVFVADFKRFKTRLWFCRNVDAR